MNLTDQVKDLQNQSIEQVKAAQTRVVEINERIADSLTSAIPPVPNPLAEYLPKPAAVVSGYFDFMSELHAANREFFENLLKAWEREPEPQPEPEHSEG
jgi:hypothetical protein